MKRSVSNVRSLFTFSLVLLNGSSKSSDFIMESTVKTNVTWSLRACPISKFVRFSSVLNFRVATKNIILPEFHCKIYFFFIFACPFHQSNLLTTAVKFSVVLNRKQENGNPRSPHKIREAKIFHSLHRFRYNSSPSELAGVTASRPYRRRSGAWGDINIYSNQGIREKFVRS